MATTDTLNTPSYISPRSANSLISFSRPTRIQIDTLEYLNKILDELLLLILTSAKSLATDRIKSDGILRVLGGQSGSGSGAGALLAKNAVLEAELELRSFLDGQRKEGGKMPLGLSATSRWDGTESFPVQSAYMALRVRCQYYSTLGDMDDPSPHSPQDQNIMSSDGRPIATLTPGVAIYVTALLEFVGEYILQNVARVMERDNSDEASVRDLFNAMDEDEGTSFWWSKMQIRKTIRTQQGGKLGQGKVQKPWQVPDASELDQAAGKKKSHRQSVGMGSMHDHQSYQNDMRGSRGTGQSVGGATSPTMSSSHASTTLPSTGSGSTADHGSATLKRRTSTERGAWFLGKRRGSFRSSQDLSGQILTSSDRVRPALSVSVGQGGVLAQRDINGAGEEQTDGGDTFDSLVMSGQTMKVSLTPNRLRSLDASTERSPDENLRNHRRRPGTGTASLRPDDSRPGSRMSTLPSTTAIEPVEENVISDGPSHPLAQRSTPARGSSKAAPPPSAYRGVEAEAKPLVHTPDVIQAGTFANTDTHEEAPLPSLPSTASMKSLVARDEKRRSMSVRDMVDMINNTSPPSPKTTTDGAFSTMSNGRESRMSVVSQASTETSSRRMTLSAASGKVFGLFTRKTSMTTPASPTPSMSTTTSRAFSSTDHRPSLANSFMGGGEESNGIAQAQSNSKPRQSGPVDRMDAKPLPPTNLVELALDARAASKSTAENSIVPERATKKDASPPAEPIELTPSGVDTVEDSKMEERPTLEMVGVYQQPRANGSTSTLSSTKGNATATASRKVPWAYNRTASGGRRASGPMTGGGRIGSGSSSQGHDQQIVQAAPPSAWSQAPFAVADADATLNSDQNIRTPALGISPTLGRSSPSPRLYGSSKSETARSLVQLNQRMRECGSVEECQRLVTQALAVAAAAVHSTDADSADGGSVVHSPLDVRRSISSASGAKWASRGDDLKLPPKEQEASASPASAATERTFVPLHRPIKYRNLALPMAVGYQPSEDDDLPMFRHQSVVAAWLLDNEGSEPDMRLSSKPSEAVLPSSATSKTLVSDATMPATISSDAVTADDASIQGFEMMPSAAAARTGNMKTLSGVGFAAVKTVNGGADRLPRASESVGTAAVLAAGEDDDEEEQRRISTVSSSYSTYRDAEDAFEDAITVS